MTVSPAYGRDFKSQKEVKAAWAEGKDFIIQDYMHPNCGAYINKQDADSDNISVMVRYSKMTKIVKVQ